MKTTLTANSWTPTPLSELVADTRSGFASGARDDAGTVQIRMNNVDTSGMLDLTQATRVPASSKQIEEFGLRPGDVLFNNTNSTDLVGKTAVFSGYSDPVVFSNHFTRVRVKPDILDPWYLGRWLTYQQHRKVFTGLCTRWVNQSAVRADKLLGLKIPLPPLSEQKRIADILDKADAIRRKRQEAAAEVSALRRSIFLKLFGDPATNPRGWQESEFADVLSGGMRNGISPSRAGRHPGKVLVLSAITGPAFDRTAVKESTFADPFNEDQLVNDKEFLICRGNGNVRLVGAGRFPTASMADTVFPDTMIAAKIDSTRLVPEYLEELWTTRHVRHQIESGARTTNGTYKVNQGVLSAIRIPLPPLEEQQQYASSIQTIRRLHERLQSKEADDLFYSLVQRAFKGEL